MDTRKVYLACLPGMLLFLVFRYVFQHKSKALKRKKEIKNKEERGA